ARSIPSRPPRRRQGRLQAGARHRSKVSVLRARQDRPQAAGGGRLIEAESAKLMASVKILKNLTRRHPRGKSDGSREVCMGSTVVARKGSPAGRTARRRSFTFT